MGTDASRSLPVLFTSGLEHHRAGRLEQAEPIYRRVLEIDPGHAEALHFLGVIAHQRGRHDEAVRLIREAIAHDGRSAAFYTNLGSALKALGALEPAADAYRQALVLRPGHVEASYNLGVVLQAQGRLDQAAKAYLAVMTLRPDHTDALINLGNVRRAQGDLEAAAVCFRRALGARPDLAQAWLNLGAVLQAQGRWDEAAEAFGRALRLRPDFAEAHNNLGVGLCGQDRLEEAVVAFRRAIAHKPDYAEALRNLADSQHELGRAGPAEAAYRQALAIAPDNAAARLGLAVAAVPLLPLTADESAQALAGFDRALDELEAWSGADPAALNAAAGAAQPFHLAYRPADLTAALSRYGDLICAGGAAGAAAPAPTGLEGRRLRLAIVCGHVRRHPVWDMILKGWITHLDRRRFEVILYHTGVRQDEETTWARTQVERFVQGPKPRQAWLDQIARDQPDVLLYPEVGMDPVTCALAALRLAPLQAAAWGHPVTTGLPSIDLFISGEALEPPDAQSHYRERLVRLPGTGVCTAGPQVKAADWRGPPRREGVVRFALCQQPIKFDPADDRLLAQIASAVGPSEFWLVAPRKLAWTGQPLHDRLAAAFAEVGLDPDAHLRVTPWMAADAFAGFLDDMDIYLDCPAFSGYTTAWTAAHRGLPIVTLEGGFLRQRLAAGLLRSLGQTDGIADRRQRYVEIAAQWAGECRHQAGWSRHRADLRLKAGDADGDLSGVRALEARLSAEFVALSDRRHVAAVTDHRGARNDSNVRPLDS